MKTGLILFSLLISFNFATAHPMPELCDSIYLEVHEDARIDDNYCGKMEELHRREACASSRLRAIVRNKFEYPEAAAEASKTGSLQTLLVIDQEGNLLDVEFENEIGYGCEEEITRILKTLPTFIPAKIDGVPVCSKLPVAFICKPKKSNVRLKTVEEVARIHHPECEPLPIRIDREGCSRVKLQTFLEENLIYPEDSKINGTEGVVVVRIAISEKGEITKKEIMNSLDESCDAEALRVIDSVPKWVPAKSNNKPRSSNLTLKVKFFL